MHRRNAVCFMLVILAFLVAQVMLAGCSKDKGTNPVIDTQPPAAPVLRLGVSGGGVNTIVWNPNTESDLAGYNVYEHDPAAQAYTRLNRGLITTTSFNLHGLKPGGTFFFVVTAKDTHGNESHYSNALRVVTVISLGDKKQGPVRNDQGAR